MIEGTGAVYNDKKYSPYRLLFEKTDNLIMSFVRMCDMGI